MLSKNNFQFFLVLIPLTGYMVLGPVGGYYAYFIFLFLLFVFYGCKYFSLDGNVLSLSIIFIVAILIGGVNTILDVNDLTNYVIYSTLSISYIFAILAGKYFSFDFKQGVKILMILAFSELLLVIPRVLIVGLDVRTSLGFTYLLPCIFLFIKSDAKGLVIFIITSILYFAAIFTSGLRSVLIPGILIYIVSLLFLFKTVNEVGILIDRKKYLFIAPLVIIATLMFASNVFNFKDRIYHATNVVIVRMEQTLLNSDGARLDPNEGRQEESAFALEAFEKDASILNYFVGMGYGFSYRDNSKDGELSAHVHITPIAYFIRHGFLSLIIYLLLFYGVVKSFFSANKINFAIKFSLLVWLLSSLFAGVIIMPIFWFFWSFVVYSRLKT